MDNLFEGLKAGDLEELVLPLVSIDEYESKLDDDSVVVAFFVGDKDPAQDLNRFIQKGATSILDTDVSPAPNEDGYFMVFVEILRGSEMPRKLMDILDSLEGLTGITEWMGQVYGQGEPVVLDVQFLIDNVRLVPQEPEDDENETDTVEESISEFFRASDLESLVCEGNKVVMEARGVAVELQYMDHGSFDDVYENNAVMASATRIDEAANANCRRVQRMLGDFWIVEQRGEHLLVANALHEVALFRIA